MAYDQNNPFATQQHSDQDQIQVGGGADSNMAQNMGRQRMSSFGGKGGGGKGGGGKGGKGGKGNAWQAIIKAALGGIGGGLTGAANAQSQNSNPFGDGFGNNNTQSPFSGGGR